jgi:hypothetical protein
MPRPVRVDAGALANARAAYRKAKNRLITIDGPAPSADLARSMAEAVADTALRYAEPAVPQSFWSNCGFSGLSKWKQMLTDTKDKKGWPTLFSEGPRAYAGLQRAYESIECQVAPGAGRSFYAEFLDAAAKTLGRPKLSTAAAAYREAGAAWSKLAALVAESPDKALREACAIADRRLELGDSAGNGAAKESVELWERRMKLAGDCRLSRQAALAIYGEIAGLLEVVIAAEEAAVNAMRG